MINESNRDLAINALEKWLDQETLVGIITELIYGMDQIKQPIPTRIKKNPAQFLVSYFGHDLLAQKMIREKLVYSLMEKKPEIGIKKLLMRLIDSYSLPQSHNEKIDRAIVQRWYRGGPSANVFTTFFDFPEEFAGIKLPSYRLIPKEEIKASDTWGGLHDYQKVILNKMRDWFSNPDSTDDGSGIMVLPTGTGKTRVAVSLLIEDFKRTYAVRGSIRHNILWIAHTKELCEQAYDTMARTWMKEGAPGQYLNIYRFWENIDSGNLIGANGIIVAGIQKLSRIFDREDDITIFENYIKPYLRLIVVDEAHLSDNPSYVKILDFLSDSDKFDPKESDTWKLLGLTATPFKNDDKRTRNLQNMYLKGFHIDKSDSNILTDIDKLGEIKWMQSRKYLSNDVNYRVFQMSRKYHFSFTESEKRYIHQFQDIGDSALTRLSIHMERNDVIIDKIKWCIEHEKSKKILLFACSVPHCYILSSQLSEHGIDNRLVTGKMSRQERAENINSFKNNPGDGPIVMINFAILTTGFDDPFIDTIFIARPTYSKVLYHQMIGRGLRGKNNGGNANGKCLIVDIKDNFDTFSGFSSVIDFMDEAKKLGVNTELFSV